MKFNQIKLLLTGFLLLGGIFSWGSEKEDHLQCQMALDRGKLIVSAKQSAVIKVSLVAPVVIASPDRAPVNIGVVLDTSGSMQGAKLRKAKDGALEALRRLNREDRFSVITYSSSARVLVAASSKLASPENVRAIETLRAGGSTALFAGVSLGAAEMRKSLDSHNIHRLILLSDGLANVGPDSPEDLGRLAQALSKEGIAVATVGLGDDYNEDLMTRLSQSSEGNTYYVENQNDLPRIFQKELGDVLNVYAQNVVLHLTFPNNVRPVKVLGRNASLANGEVTVPLKQIYGGQEKFVLVEVEVMDGRLGEVRELARAKVDYRPVTGKSLRSTKARVAVAFTQEKAEVIASINKKVQRDTRLMENTVSVDKALAYAKDGKNQAAAKELRRSAAELTATAKQNQDGFLLQKAEEMKLYAQDIETKKLSKKKRKILRTENYQQRIQQATGPEVAKQADIEAKKKKEAARKPKRKPKPTKENEKKSDQNKETYIDIGSE